MSTWHLGVLCLSLCLTAQPQPAATTVTLTATDLPLTKAVAEIARQSGINVTTQPGDPDPKVSLELKNEPLWKAIDRLAEVADARVTILPRDGRIILVKRQADQRKPIVSTSGPFRFCVKRVTASWDLDTDTRTYSAAVEVAWEPWLQPLFLETIPQGVVAFDDKGRQHPVPDAGKGQAPVDGRMSLMIDVPLPALPRTTLALAKLEGRLDVVTPSKMEQFDFPHIVKGAALTRDSVTCKITKVAWSEDRGTVQVTIENPPGGTILESYQPWDSNNTMTLLSKDGKTRFIANSYVRESESSRRAVLSYHFTDRTKLARLKLEEWSLVYQTPALVVTVPLTFSFQDVPLP